MNNSQILMTSLTVTEEVDTAPLLREKERELLQIIEALGSISASDYWKLLEEKVFNGVVDSLQAKLRSEKNPTEIYRLQGQIMWAEKYTDLTKVAQAYKNELTSIRNRLND